MRFRLAVVVLVVFLLPSPLFGQQQQDPQLVLQQRLAELQKTPNDVALREKIIKHVQTMQPEPAIPEEARRHFVIAKTLFADSKEPKDFADAIAEFKSALLIAPWWPEANRDLGLALEAAQQFDEATAYIKLYMVTNPGEERIRAAQDEIYKIEAKKQIAERTDNRGSGATEKKRANIEEARVKGLDGTWCSFEKRIGKCLSWSKLEIRSDDSGHYRLSWTDNDHFEYSAQDVQQIGRSIRFTRLSHGKDPQYFELTLSPNGSELNGTIRLRMERGWETWPVSHVKDGSVEYVQR